MRSSGCLGILVRSSTCYGALATSTIERSISPPRYNPRLQQRRPSTLRPPPLMFIRVGWRRTQQGLAAEAQVVRQHSGAMVKLPLRSYSALLTLGAACTPAPVSLPTGKEPAAVYAALLDAS